MEKFKLAISQDILDALEGVLGKNKCNLHEPVFDGQEAIYLEKCIKTTFVSSVGPFVEEFEERLANYCGVKRAVATTNGTVALQVALKVAGVENGDEVLVTPFTFVGTVNSIIHAGGIPHFVDVEPDTFGIDPNKLSGYLSSFTELSDGKCLNTRTGRNIKALVPVHVFGHPCKIIDLVAVAEQFRIKLIEDAAESLGSFFNGKHLGGFGTLGIISFNGNKIITTGGGGAILTDDSDLADEAKHLTTTAKMPHLWNYAHDKVGFNFRMPNLNAALGCAQIQKLNSLLCLKKAH